MSDTAQIEALQSLLSELALQMVVHGSGAIDPNHIQQIAGKAAGLSLGEVDSEIERLRSIFSSPAPSTEAALASLGVLQSLVDQACTALHDEPEGEDATLVFEEDMELLADFVLEADEHLASIDEGILALEKDPSQTETVHSVFRSFHSIKGLAGFLGLAGVQRVAHEVETLLDMVRNATIRITPDLVDLVLESSEYLKEEVARVKERIQNLPLSEVRSSANLIAKLSEAVAAAKSAKEDVSLAGVDESKPKQTGDDTPAALQTADADTAANAGIDTHDSNGHLLNDLSGEPMSALIAEAPASTGKQGSSAAIALVTSASHASENAEDSAVRSAMSDSGVIGQNKPAARPVLVPSERGIKTDSGAVSVRVETSKLDRLMDMVGELVIAQSILSNHSLVNVPHESRLGTDLQKLARITGEVQRCAMSMRMTPIGPLFQKNAKMVRDLARKHNKQVDLQLSGESTELDKTIAEELADPLLHMIRNALDHGIELPHQRVAAGKPATANLCIDARHQAGQIVVSISDDGRGLDAARIRQKAVNAGIIDESAVMTEEEIFGLIFEPGFSTAEKITDISGRGVGMDVVRRHVEALRGRIETESILGKGTKFSIHLPLTLAIIEGLAIVVGEHRYIVPLFSVREMLRPTRDMLFSVRGTEEMILLRGKLLPLVRLHKNFDIVPRSTDICEGLLVVCEFSGKMFCLFVDDLIGRQEVVIKSLDPALRTVKGLVGSAILGDGGIGLILDVAGVFHAPRLDQEAICA